jgi:hypothetical protein
MIEIEIKRDGEIVATGLIPGQDVRLRLPTGACYRITRFGIAPTVCIEKEKA